MSFFKSRLKSNQQSEYETTEMTPIVDLDPIMTLMDGRNSLSNILPADENDDSTSQSSQSTSSNGVKYNYSKEEEEEERLLGEEEEQSLVLNSDLEDGTPKKKKKVNTVKNASTVIFMHK